ncbi:MAG: hypothetical protein ACO1OQ_11345, partial [Rufibacter sp.]
MFLEKQLKNEAPAFGSRGFVTNNEEKFTKTGTRKILLPLAGEDKCFLLDFNYLIWYNRGSLYVQG